MALTLEQYAEYLDSRDLKWPAPPDVVKPKAKPHVAELSGIRAVTWGVYGTLLNISHGELLFEHPQQFIMDIALDKTIQEFKMWGSMTRKPGQPSEYLGQIYRKVLSDFRSRPSHEEKHPEICSEQIWEEILKKLFHKDYTFDVNFFGSLNEYSHKVAYFFHLSLQGTTSYDFAPEILKHLSELGIMQGIIENGQRFTPLQLQKSLQQVDGAFQFSSVFNKDLIVLSCDLRGRKPSSRLYRNISEQLETQGISPQEVLHIGNSISRDIIPAKKVGFRTALFAGDKNSLEATPEQLKDPNSRPDRLVTELGQITRILDGSGVSSA